MFSRPQLEKSISLNVFGIQILYKRTLSTKSDISAVFTTYNYESNVFAFVTRLLIG